MFTLFNKDLFKLANVSSVQYFTAFESRQTDRIAARKGEVLNIFI